MAQAALAQQAPRPEKLYVNSSVLLGSARMVGLGGAYVGIAEGADGWASNLASLAQRPKDLDREWNIDFGLSYVDVPTGNPMAWDVDNDGVPDSSLRARQYITGIALQYRTFGVGAFTRTSYQAYCLDSPGCPVGDALNITLSNSALAIAASFLDDDLIGAVGLYTASATFSLQGQQWNYGATSFSADVLWRPHGQPFRLGASFRPRIEAALQSGSPTPPVVDGRPLYSAVVTPATLSAGASLRVGPGAEDYNRLSPIARFEALDRHGAMNFYQPPREPLSWKSLLISLEVDSLFPVKGATQLATVTSGADPVPLGTVFAITPRLGLENETLPGRLRIRAGTFLEPSPFPADQPRAHATGGFELYLLHFLDDWSIAGSFDVANRYTQYSVAIGFWR